MGLRMSTTLGNSMDNFTLRGTAGWQHVYGDLDNGTTVRFASGATPFTVFGQKTVKDSAVVGLDADATFNNSTTAYLHYNGLLGIKDQDHAVSLGLKIAFSGPRIEERIIPERNSVVFAPRDAEYKIVTPQPRLQMRVIGMPASIPMPIVAVEPVIASSPLVGDGSGKMRLQLKKSYPVAPAVATYAPTATPMSYQAPIAVTPQIQQAIPAPIVHSQNPPVNAVQPAPSMKLQLRKSYPVANTGYSNLAQPHVYTAPTPISPRVEDAPKRPVLADETVSEADTPNRFTLVKR